jgi:hypothetical protein
MNILDGPDSINMCIVNQDVFKMVYIIDLDGTLRPSNNTTTTTPGGPATLIANDDMQLERLVTPHTKCTRVSAGCYKHCINTCFRSVRFEAVIPSNLVQPMIKVCRRGNRNLCSLFPGGRRAVTEPLTFTVHLPVGNLYDGVFVHGNGTEFVVPSLLQELEPSLCPGNDIFGVTLYGSLPIL